MALVRDAKTLSNKAVSSMRTAMSTFNGYDDEGRVCSVLLHLQHACEMLLKAVLVQNKIKVFDDKTGRSIGFARALHLCRESRGLSETEAGTMRVIDALRDAEQHWFTVIDEDVLYLHTRAVITVFHDYLMRSLDVDLTSRIPPRVLPVSTKPPGDFDFLIDREYKLIAELLKPGNRKRDEARARIRAMLAMEGLVVDEVQVSEKDINRIEKAVRAGSELGEVFPRLNTIGSAIEGEGPTITVHFSKKQGPPVKFVAGDNTESVAAVRELDLQKKFRMGAAELAKSLNLTGPRAVALRRYLKIDEDESCRHTFEFGKAKHDQFSGNARVKMKEALDNGVDMDAVWKDFRPGKK
ncbi:hypothetical protein HFN84_03820 [Rhizobium laguerreae]|nr:hypothetical protein [Rhizobium laguerreae]MBY3349909.1 hypothetical protein [Rhizobium laguerreae]MBY3371012.1 hypothetical protein [Rhizobium laguerreae]MBY3426252.1 hypothetical protein [Rhizobium laguerreae]MBY3434196.1 hypothetical protein [Rhizobium laguerreae]